MAPLKSKVSSDVRHAKSRPQMYQTWKQALGQQVMARTDAYLERFAGGS